MAAGDRDSGKAREGCQACGSDHCRRAAEAAGAELLHYNEDFELIAQVTGQPVRRLAAKGSLR